MPRGNKIQIRTGSAAPSAADFATSEPAWDSSAGKLYVKNAAGSMVEVGAGSSSLATYATAANFPATGSATVLYLAEDTSQLFQWESPVYVEIGVSGGGSGSSSFTLPNATTSTLGGVVVGTGLSVSSGTVSANVVSVAGRTGTVTISSGDVSGLPTAGTGSTNYCAGDDARLSDSRSPTIHAHSAADITSGTLADARLSANVALHSAINSYNSGPSSGLDIYPRGEAANLTMTLQNSAVYFSFFTPVSTVTVSSIMMASGTTTAASGLTLARMGLYTFDETTATLVARTASDTTLFTTVNTAYQRSFSTAGAGSYPASYQLTAGTRYGIAIIFVGTTPPQCVARTSSPAWHTQTPRTSGNLALQSDLPATASASAFGIQQGMPFARLS